METPLSVLLKEKTPGIHSTTPEISVYECSVKLNQLKMGALLVLDTEQRLLGIVSERDILGKIVALGKDPKGVPVETIMTTKLITVLPSTSVHEAMRIMTEHRVRHLPVMDNDKTIGVISIGDLTRWVMLLQEKQISSLTSYIQGEHL
jgi:CBS domain-containing protein